jgi:hypothetical protein
MTDPSTDHAIIDDLVADIIDSARKHVSVANESIGKLTTDQRLIDRYGDFNLGISFSGPGGIPARAAIHRALKDKGLSQRQIAEVTGTPRTTVERDLAGPNGPPAERDSGPNGPPAERETEANASPIEREPVEADEPEEEVFEEEVILPPPTPPYTGKSYATSTPPPDPRPEVLAVVKSIKGRGLSITERTMLNNALRDH